MALSSPRIIFGIHSMAAANRTTGEFYGIAKVLQNSSLSLSGELIELTGGSQKYAWAVEDGLVTAEMSLQVSEYPAFFFTLFAGKAPTENAAEASGSVTTVANKNGTSIVASTGLASVSAIPTTGPADLKFGTYVLKYATATTLDIFVSSDINFARGTDETYDNDLLKVGTTGAITTGGNTDVASLGLRFVGGAGVIAFTSGDTATFQVRPPNTASMDVVIGAASDVFPEFEAFLYAKQRGSLEMVEVNAYRCKGVGLPIGFEFNAFSQPEISVRCFYDSVRDGVLKVRHVAPTS